MKWPVVLEDTSPKGLEDLPNQTIILLPFLVNRAMWLKELISGLVLVLIAGLDV